MLYHLLAMASLAASCSASASGATAPLNMVFEIAVLNNHTKVANKFSGVTLNTTFHSPTDGVSLRAAALAALPACCARSRARRSL